MTLQVGLEAKLFSMEVAMSEAHTTAETSMESMRTHFMQELVGYRVSQASKAWFTI